MQLNRYHKSVFEFLVWLQESKYIFVFSDLINDENWNADKSVGKVFLWWKLDQGSCVHLSTL
jgi:hypothetical protein